MNALSYARPGFFLRKVLISTACVGALLTAPTSAFAVKLVVRAAPALEARAFVDGEAFVLRGTLRDDVGTPIPSAHVEVSVIAAGGSAPLPLPAPQPCSASAGGHPPHASPDAYVLDTDVAGVFCARTGKLPDVGLLRVRFAGFGALEAVALEAPYDVSRAAPTWAWDPKPDELDLDVPRTLATVVVSEGTRAVEGTPLTVWDERGIAVAAGRTDAEGRAALSIETRVLAAPGAGTWEVFPGSARPAAGASANPPLRAAVTRVARVSLVTAPPTAAIVPADGYAFDVVAETSRGPAEGGAVEAAVGDRVVGAGPVRGGKARVQIAFELKGAGSVPLTFRYLSASPFLRPGPAVTIPLAVRPPSPWRRTPLLLLGLVVLGWIARSWRRAPAAPREATAVDAPPVAEIVAQPVRDADGWEGTVIDAHTRRPVATATVSLMTRDFHGERVTNEATTDREGRFRLTGRPTPGALLVIEAALHSRLERALPPPGKLGIALVLRRRSVLNRLIEAARKAGGGWVGEVEPTPGRIAKVGLEAGRRDPAAWALAVESAAFGDGAVDAATERRIDAMETELPQVPARDVRR